jgi:hypothetical protein
LLDEPRIALRDCDYCQRVEHDDGPNGNRLPVVDPATGEDLQREPPHREFAPLGWAPCRMKQAGMSETGCPKGTPEESNALTPRNQRAYQFFKECQAVGRHPDDPIATTNAVIITEIETEWARAEQRRAIELAMLKARAAALGADG